MIVNSIRRVLSDLRRSGIQAVRESTPSMADVETEIVVEHLSGRLLKRFVSIAGQLTIGRAPGCTVQVDGPSVSRVHARIVIGPTDVEVEDYSTNGTFVGNELLHRGRVHVAFGTPISVGTHILRVQPLQLP